MHHNHSGMPAHSYHATISRNWMRFLSLLILMQQVQHYLCYPYDTKQHQKRRLQISSNDVSFPMQTTENSMNDAKRTLISGGSISQPEEIFSANDQLESNYDEYPMVVPKRAALLLDRLMVALHHALEKEHSGNARLSDFYSKSNDGKNSGSLDKDKSGENGDSSDILDKDSPYFTMYSDDDPSVMMDYDFKDLNSINRATGETLMAQSFQRRANLGLDLGGDIGTDGVSSLLAASSPGHGGGLISGVNSADIAVVGGGGRTNFGSNGRMYWRCYFNAVSCF